MTELTAANEEVRVKVGAGHQARHAARSGPHRRSCRSWPWCAASTSTTRTGEIIVSFERSKADAETVIGHVLWILLHAQVRISGVSKGRGLEQRVMDLT